MANLLDISTEATSVLTRASTSHQVSQNPGGDIITQLPLEILAIILEDFSSLELYLTIRRLSSRWKQIATTLIRQKLYHCSSCIVSSIRTSSTTYLDSSAPTEFQCFAPDSDPGDLDICTWIPENPHQGISTDFRQQIFFHFPHKIILRPSPFWAVRQRIYRGKMDLETLIYEGSWVLEDREWLESKFAAKSHVVWDQVDLRRPKVQTVTVNGRYGGPWRASDQNIRVNGPFSFFKMKLIDGRQQYQFEKSSYYRPPFKGSHFLSLMDTIFSAILPQPQILRAFIPLCTYPVRLPLATLSPEPNSGFLSPESVIKDLLLDPDLEVHVVDASPDLHSHASQILRGETCLYISSKLAEIYEELCIHDFNVYCMFPSESVQVVDRPGRDKYRKDSMEILIFLVLIHEFGHYISLKYPSKFCTIIGDSISSELYHLKTVNSHAYAESRDNITVDSLHLFEPGEAAEVSLFGGIFQVYVQEPGVSTNPNVPNFSKYFQRITILETPLEVLSAHDLRTLVQWLLNPIDRGPFIEADLWQLWLIQRSRPLSLGTINRTHISPNGEKRPFQSGLATPTPEGRLWVEKLASLPM